TVSMLSVLTYRPEFVPPWSMRSHMTPITLNRLERSEAEALIWHQANGKQVPSEVIEHIVGKTDGVPLYVEELTKAILEADFLRECDAGYELTRPLSGVTIPATLQDSLMARLDRLPTIREVAQLGAVLGREFTYEMLRAIASLEETTLQEGLDRLVDAELLYQRGRPPRAKYIFKHALVQDAAYQSMLKRTRQYYHEQVAELLQSRFPEIVESQPELVGHHYTEGGLAEPAIDYWLKAGRRAMQRSANVEAEGHLRKGLTVLDGMPQTAERRRREIALQNTLGVCLMPTRGFGDADVDEAFSRAAVVSEEQGDSRGQFVALRGKGQYQMISGDLRTAREQARRILVLADELDDPGIRLEAHHLGWSTFSFTGDYEAARKHSETGIALYERERDHPLTYIYSGHDPGMCCRSFGSLSLWQLGYTDQALALCYDGEALAKDLAHPFTVTIALWATGLMNVLRRDAGATHETGEEMIAYCSEKGFPPFIPMGKIFRGGALAELGEAAGGIAELREGIAGVRARGTEYTVPAFFAWLSDLCVRCGQLDEGLAALQEGLAMSEANADQFSLPEFHRIEGAVHLARSADAKAEAEACFQRAIEIARGNTARTLELRAATRLARLWGESNRRAEAHELLAPLYGWFTEGFDTPDLQDAKALLDELS
ncbi:MAG: adenylate/guanylate cyclase domain-containing protein, partial [Gemmatimonadota bacterium]